MEIRLMDEALPLGERGAALLSMDEHGASALCAGAVLTDARGNRHTVTRVEEHEGVWTLYLPKGDYAYFARLFRDVRVDATLFTVEGEGENA